MVDGGWGSHAMRFLVWQWMEELRGLRGWIKRRRVIWKGGAGACSSLASGRCRFGGRGGGIGRGSKKIYDVVLGFIQVPHTRTNPILCWPPSRVNRP